MSQVGWVFDENRCIGCRACYTACKSENRTPLRTDWRKVIERDKGTYPHPKREFLSLTCNHCDEPACQKSCPVSAISKRSDGVVLIDQSKCTGCRYCTFACPYGAPKIDTDTNLVSKCTMCVHRLDAGLQPACATACLTGAIQFVEDLSVSTGAPIPEGFVSRGLTRPNVQFVLMP